ncbi:MAG: type I methionyl aminopeptidase [Alphaproteobacteria bacterium]
MYDAEGQEPEDAQITIHPLADFAGMRVAGRLAAETLDYITPFVQPGVTTIALNDLIEKFMRDHGAIPATIDYRGYKHASCISPNHVVCHGIPGEKQLQDGDIVNIDVTVIVDGWFGDTSRMYFVGDKISLRARRLCDVTYDAMMLGIKAVKPGATLGDIGHAIQSLVEANRFSVVRDFCGHGVGRKFHTPPSVLHYGQPGTGVVLRPGMIFTVEPMVNIGGYQVKVLSDGWTAVTKDKSLSAQFEHSLGVTETGVEIFTLSPTGLDRPPYALSGG